MRSPRIIVTGVGSNIGQGIVKALRSAFPTAHVVGTNTNPVSIGFFALDAGYAVPAASDEGYTDRLVEVCAAERIELVLIGSHGELSTLSRASDDIGARTGASVLSASHAAADLCLDKWATAQHLESAGVEFARSTIDVSEEGRARFVSKAGWPLVVKPRRGQGSKAVHVVHDAAAFGAMCEEVPDPVVQEHLGSPEDEFTAAVLCDREGDVAAVTAMRRSLVGGTTVVAHMGSHPVVEDYAGRVVRVIGLTGPANVQLRLTERGPVAFEVNPRFSGTASIRALAGWNDVAAAVRHFLYGDEIDLRPPRRGMVLRYYDEVFVPEASVDRCVAQGRWNAADEDAPELSRLFGERE